jgi:hypothetical protein
LSTGILPAYKAFTEPEGAILFLLIVEPGTIRGGMGRFQGSFSRAAYRGGRKAFPHAGIILYGRKPVIFRISARRL